ncbi:RHS repeat-associated core domain-containing protein [Vibrio gallaecicus]|uniref:RHS repeat-associated core domain-containing protein n=1 Tax=Vibrio gallaecicus TaxID=552386 RepID=A0ABV4NH20_9VIBR
MKTINGILFFILFTIISKPVISEEYKGKVNYSYNITQGNVNILFPFEVYEKPRGIHFDPGFRLNSTSSNSEGLGFGWSLNGIQKISMCDPNVYHDANNYDEVKFCYGGKRLFLTHGKNIIDGSRYKIEDNVDITVTYQKKSIVRTKNGSKISANNIGVFVLENPRTGETYYFGGDNGTDTHFNDVDYLIVRKEGQFKESIQYKYNRHVLENIDTVVGIRRVIDEVSYDDITVKYNYSWADRNLSMPRLDSVKTFHDGVIFSEYKANLVTRKSGTHRYNDFLGFTECINSLCSEPVSIAFAHAPSYESSLSLTPSYQDQYKNKISTFSSISSTMKNIEILQGGNSLVIFNFEKGIINTSNSLDYPGPELSLLSHTYLLKSYTEESSGRSVQFSYQDPSYNFELKRFLSFSEIEKKISANGNQVIENARFYTEYPEAGYLKQSSSIDDVVRKKVNYTYDKFNLTKDIFEIKDKSITAVDYDDNGNPVNQKKTTYIYDTHERLLEIRERFVNLVNGNSTYEKITEYSKYGRSGNWNKVKFNEFLLPGHIKTSFFVDEILERFTTKDLFYKDYKIVKETFSNGDLSKEKTTDYYYNSIGLIETEKETFNKIDYDNEGNISNIEKGSRVKSTDYDGTFIKSSTGYTGLTTYFVKDQVCNKPKKIIDANNLTTSYIYDNRCRVIETHLPDGEVNYKKYIKSNYFNVLGKKSHYAIVSESNINPTRTTYYDINEDKIRESKISLHGNVINVDHYKSLNIKKVSKPYFSGQAIFWETTKFNLIGQVTEINTSLGNTLFSRVGNVLNKTDAIGDIEVSINDSKSRVLEKTFNNTNIKFKYDFNGNTIYANNSGVVSNYEYNHKNKLTNSTSSTSGVTISRFDYLGNLVWSKNSIGDITKSNYDKVSRLIRKKTLKKNGRTKDDHYIWDTRLYGKNLISKVSSNGFSKEYFYNEKSQLSSIIQTNDNRTFEKSFTYSDNGQLKSTTHPNDITLHHEFDNLGYLIGEYIDESNYKNVISDGKLSSLKLKINELKNKIKQQQVKDQDQIKLISDELNRLRNQNYIYSNYDINDGAQELSQEVFVDDQGRVYRKNSDGEFFRQYVGKIHDCNKWDDPRCSKIPEQLILEKVHNPNLLLDDSSYLNIDGSTGATNYELAGEFEINTVTKIKRIQRNGRTYERPVDYEYMASSFIKMKHGLSLKAKQQIALISTGLNDEIYKLNKSSGDYSDIIKLLENLEFRIENAHKLNESKQFVTDGVDRITENRDKQFIWTIDKFDEYNRVAAITHGNGTFTSKYYDSETTHLRSIKTISGISTIRDLEYGYDNVNNMLYKYDYITGAREDYQYNTGQLERYTLWYRGENRNIYQQQNYYYDNLGNIKSVSTSGKGFDEANSRYSRQTYAYDDITHPYRLTSVNGTRYQYDSSGNVTHYGDVSVEVGFYGKPVRITNNKHSLSFNYDPSANLYSQSSGNTSSYYLDTTFKEITTDSKSVSEIYVSAYGELQAVLHKSENGSIDIDYLYSDPLGSVDTVVDNQGEVKQRYTYSPFGERKTLSLVTGFVTDVLPITDKAFTGHEELHEFGLIHMGGRVYDPNLRRFISPDPIINDRTTFNSYNLYSYVFNNPMKYTDPSGFVAAEAAVDNSGSGSDISTDTLGSDDQSSDMDAQGSETPQGKEGTNNSDGFSVSDMVDAVVEFGASWGEAIASEFQPTDYEISATIVAAGSPIIGDEVVAVGYWAGKGALATVAGTARVVKKYNSEPIVEITDRLPTGFRGSKGKGRDLTNTDYQITRNAEGEVAGREYTGHAFDQMQNRGIMPSSVEQAMQTGAVSPDPIPGRTRHYDAEHNFTVIADGERVVTVMGGKR